ncbi:MAG: YfhO family protein [Gammaproteobacteria bacterium]|nr:YfhO family protein [Gammaproteobacteria bacterium]
MIGLIIWDLFSAGYSFNQSSEGPNDYYPRNELVQNLQIQQQQEGGRVSYRAGSVGLLKRNAGTVFRIAAIEGYASPLRLHPPAPPADMGVVYDLMNVTYYIQLLDGGQRAALVHNADALPRAFVVRNFVVAEDMDTVTRVLSDSLFNYRTTVTLDQTPSITIPADSVADTERPVITYYDPNRMEIDVTLTGPGLLIVGEAYYPAWRAYVDGREQPVYRADGTLRAIPLTEGSHSVVLQYQSTTFLIGSIISSLALLVVCVTGIITWRTRRKLPCSDNS